MSPPLIETNRLLLRPHAPADLKPCAEMWAAPDATRYIGGRPFTREEVWARLLRYAGHWSWLGYGFWAIQEKSSGAFAGEIGFAEFEREIDPPLSAPECGWILASPFHGRGYAHEALQAVVEWGDARFPATNCLIHPDNLRSLRLAQKCGYTELLQTSYKGQPTAILIRTNQ